MENIKEIFENPYVTQVDRFADSLKQLSETFLHLEHPKSAFTKAEVEEMFEHVSGKVCKDCDRREWCLAENRSNTYQMMHEILNTIEEYGAELNIELKRNLQKRCIYAPRFLRETMNVFSEAKQILLWNNKIVQNREGCAWQLRACAEVLQYAIRELNAGIFEDEHIEKRIRLQLKRAGLKVIHCILILTKRGSYEVHLTLKAQKNQCVQTKEVAKLLSKSMGRIMLPECGERLVVKDEYCTIVCVEGPKYYTLQGVAKIGKGCEIISGDTFFMTELGNGRMGVLLSDGMGSGEMAFRESKQVVEMLEKLLLAGFPVDMAIRMMNTVLVMGREDVSFATIDVCVFDLFQGSCELIKSGASTTFIKYEDNVEKIHSTSLPIGVVQDMEPERVKRKLTSGTFVVMMSDGVLDALPSGEQEALMSTFIKGTNIQNPKELAHHILGQVLEWTGELPQDDMTVIAVGVWER